MIIKRLEGWTAYVCSNISLSIFWDFGQTSQELRVFDVDNLEQNLNHNYSVEKREYNGVNCYSKCHSISAIFQSYVTRPKKVYTVKTLIRAAALKVLSRNFGQNLLSKNWSYLRLLFKNGCYLSAPLINVITVT